MILYQLFISIGFGVLYAQTAFAHSRSNATAAVVGSIAFIAFAASYLLPPRVYRFSNDDIAPRVMSQVIARAILASALVLAMNGVVWFLIGRRDVSVVEELYAYALTALLFFHGFGGAMTSHAVYLQATRQYNSNQLVAILALVTLVLFVLILFFLALDWAIARDAYVHVRDLMLLTLVLVGYSQAIYRMAHH